MGFVTISTAEGLASARQKGYGKHYLSREEAIEHQRELFSDPAYPIRADIDFENVFDFIHGTAGTGKEAAITEVGDIELGTLWITWPKYDPETGNYTKQ